MFTVLVVCQLLALLLSASAYSRRHSTSRKVCHQNRIRTPLSLRKVVNDNKTSNPWEISVKSNDLKRYFAAVTTATFLFFPQFATAAADYRIMEDPNQIVQQGMSLFRKGDVKGSIAQFNRATDKSPSLSAIMWQRGLSYYYAEQYDEGSKQFRYDIAANPSDAEEIIWTVLCESKLQGFPTALANMPILPRTDRRPIMRAVFDMFQGKTDEKTLIGLGDKSGFGNSGGDYFYSRLYLSLYREAKGDVEASKQFMQDAVKSYYGKTSSDYMTAVARVHLASR
jgi:tetratricopeptide (TPR) repeat protein